MEDTTDFDAVRLNRLFCGSLFSGIGGMDLGLERAGFDLKWQVEIDPYCRRVLERHWPTVRRWDDVRTWPQPDTERVDLLCGGFPCQDISDAGNRAGIEGERSGLWREYARIIRDLRPPLALTDLLGGFWSCVMADNVLQRDVNKGKIVRKRLTKRDNSMTECEASQLAASVSERDRSWQHFDEPTRAALCILENCRGLAGFEDVLADMTDGGQCALVDDWALIIRECFGLK